MWSPEPALTPIGAQGLGRLKKPVEQRTIVLSNSNNIRALPQDTALRERARKVIPGGMWGHMNAKRLPQGFPQFFAEAKGTRLRDVDGNEYLDFMCSFGPMILGYGDPEVDAAASAQRARMAIANGPGEVLVELAEKMVETIPAADWAMFSKNGTDATTACVMIARAQTARRKILIAKGAYHGSAPWCTPWPGGTTAEDRAHQINSSTTTSPRSTPPPIRRPATWPVSSFRHSATMPGTIKNCPPVTLPTPPGRWRTAATRR